MAGIFFENIIQMRLLLFLMIVVEYLSWTFVLCSSHIRLVKHDFAYNKTWTFERIRDKLIKNIYWRKCYWSLLNERFFQTSIFDLLHVWFLLSKISNNKGIVTVLNFDYNYITEAPLGKLEFIIFLTLIWLSHS